MFRARKQILICAALIVTCSWTLAGCAGGGGTGSSAGGPISGPAGSENAKGVNGTGAASGSGMKDKRVPAGPP